MSDAKETIDEWYARVGDEEILATLHDYEREKVLMEECLTFERASVAKQSTEYLKERTEWLADNEMIRVRLNNQGTTIMVLLESEKALKSRVENMQDVLSREHESHLRTCSDLDSLSEHLGDSIAGRLTRDIANATSPGLINVLSARAIVEAIERQNQPPGLFGMVQEFNEHFGLYYDGKPRMLPKSLEKLKRVHLHE